jgi:hypothetical protein
VGHPECESVRARRGGISVDVEFRDPDHGVGSVVQSADGEQAEHELGVEDSPNETRTGCGFRK